MLWRLRGTELDVDVDDAALEGSYPETRIRVSYTTSGGKKVTHRYELWDSVFEGPDGGRTPADDVAVLIHTWISGG